MDDAYPPNQPMAAAKSGQADADKLINMVGNIQQSLSNIDHRMQEMKRCVVVGGPSILVSVWCGPVCPVKHRGWSGM